MPYYSSEYIFIQKFCAMLCQKNTRILPYIENKEFNDGIASMRFCFQENRQKIEKIYALEMSFLFIPDIFGSYRRFQLVFIENKWMSNLELLEDGRMRINLSEDDVREMLSYEDEKIPQEVVSTLTDAFLSGAGIKTRTSCF